MDRYVITASSKEIRSGTHESYIQHCFRPLDCWLNVMLQYGLIEMPGSIAASNVRDIIATISAYAEKDQCCRDVHRCLVMSVRVLARFDRVVSRCGAFASRIGGLGWRSGQCLCFLRFLLHFYHYWYYYSLLLLL